MDERLRDALQPVLADARRAGVPVPEVFDEDWSDDEFILTAMIGRPGSNTVGIKVMSADTEVDRVVEAADQVQEWVIDELWPGAPSNWPACPHHPTAHPLAPARQGDVARWVCPADFAGFDAVGSLGLS